MLVFCCSTASGLRCMSAVAFAGLYSECTNSPPSMNMPIPTNTTTIITYHSL